MSDAIAAAAKIPYLLQDLNRLRPAVEKAIHTRGCGETNLKTVRRDECIC
ncbi:MAG: hypothetical protein HC862_00635 [Scytonema sp. RU_4_4]|nr:hypothetical protein [Scytonema sp. RU_4_4]NJR73264.1 hypothetical protein [Scytonema sp. CRU_2_7]